MDHDQLDQRLRTGVRIPCRPDPDRIARILARIEGEPGRRRRHAGALALLIGAGAIAVLAANRPNAAPTERRIAGDTPRVAPADQTRLEMRITIEQPLKAEGELALADARDAVSRVVSDLPPSVAERLGRVFRGRS